MDAKDLAPDDAASRALLLADAIRKNAAGTRFGNLAPVRVRHAVQCGQALTELKALVQHGEFDRWVEEQCGLNRATANRYMRLASHADRLTPYMSLRQAYIAAGVIHPRAGAVRAPCG